MPELVESRPVKSFDVNNELKKLPGKPGVYIMKSIAGEIIYIGKAVSLKNRVKQYFQSNTNHTPKIKILVSKIDSFEYIVTDSEFEALILECNLIKKHRPRYNVLLKDDKHFPYIKITVNEEYPRVLMTRKIIDDGAKYFGPYLNVHSIYDTIQELRRVFPLKSCKRVFPRDFGKERPCLNYHIGTCMGPCTGRISKEEYDLAIRDICIFLSGKHEKIVDNLEAEMHKAADEMRFEAAAKMRDKLAALRHIQEKQKVLSTAQHDQDVTAYYSDGIDTCISVFFIRGGKLVGKEQFVYEGAVSPGSTELLSEFIQQFYANTDFIPKEVIIQDAIEGISLLEMFLSKKKGTSVNIIVPSRGEKLSMVKMVQKNAEIEFTNKKAELAAEEGRIREGLEIIESIVGISFENGRIEAMDVSNYGENDKVASLIVFEQGRPLKPAYRRFKIVGVTGQDDYACMQEALFRRFKNMVEGKANFKRKPDLFLVDGGKGHLSSAIEVIRSLNLNIPVAGMAKDARHNTSSLVTVKGETGLADFPQALRLISAIQEEAHRFAVDYSKKLAAKRLSISELDDIKGVGKRRKMALLAHFKSLGNVRKAELEEIEEVIGIDKPTARNIYEHFRR
ncbi:MAG: excinuclease ABC subunit UvrC [Oscillospiraceae bacterium]|nr:excinuclease ABC subunit UvrC [Oscillospiraceae bacterium]